MPMLAPEVARPMPAEATAMMDAAAAQDALVGDELSALVHKKFNIVERIADHCVAAFGSIGCMSGIAKIDDIISRDLLHDCPGNR